MTNKLHIFKRLNDIEKRLRELDNKWLKHKRLLFCYDLFGDNDTDAAEILERINEIYDFLGVTRDSVESKTFLKKKPARKK